MSGHRRTDSGPESRNSGSAMSKERERRLNANAVALMRSVEWNVIGGRKGAPHLLLHGTDPSNVAAIRREGLTPFDPTVRDPESPDDIDGIYMTTALAVAREVACERQRGGRPTGAWLRPVEPKTSEWDDGCLLVDVRGLPLLAITGIFISRQKITAPRILGSYGRLYAAGRLKGAFAQKGELNASFRLKPRKRS
jgi:hypothetical protein